jgi:hypothetical protein
LPQPGAISAEHVEVILRTLDKLPKVLPVAEVESMEQTLVGHARTFQLADVRGIGKHLLSVLNPDGVLTEEKDQQRRRKLGLVPSGDGLHRLTGELDDECAAVAMAVLHSLAAPMPTDAGGRDDRTAGQRMHDALKALCKLALRAGELPKSGGVPATVLISMTKQQFETGTGLATTSFGQTHRPHRPQDRRPSLHRVNRARLQTQTPDARTHPTPGERRPNTRPDRPGPRLRFPEL